MGSARIEEEIWTDPKMSGLTCQERLLFIWLFSNPYRHFSGIYYLPKEIIPRQTGLSAAEVETGMDTLINRGIVRFSNEFNIIFVINMLSRQTGKSTNLSFTQRAGITTHIATLHHCPLVAEFYKKYGDYFEPETKDKYTPIDTPIDTQSKSKSKSKSNSKKIPSSIQKSARKIKVPLPDDFEITDRVKEWARKNNYGDLEGHYDAFKRKAIMNGYVYVNWDMAFMEAIREDWANIRVKGYGRQEDQPKWIQELSKAQSTS